MCVCGRERSLRLFEVLTRGRRSAVGLRSRANGARVQPLGMFTIPPRQRLPVTRRLAIRARKVAHSSRRRIKSIPRFVFCKTIRHSSRASEKMKSSNNKQHKLFHIIRETKALWRSYTHTYTHKRAVFTHARAHKESRENFTRSFLSSCLLLISLNPKLSFSKKIKNAGQTTPFLKKSAHDAHI